MPPVLGMIKVPPNELNAISAPWPFTAWGMDVIGPIEPTASNGHRFILVAINYFTKWVEAASYKVLTMKVVAAFVKKILRKMVENHKLWDEKLPFALLGYRTTIRTSTGETQYLLVYGIKAVIPAKVETSSLRIIQEAELSDAEWIRSRFEQLALIDGNRMNVLCHGQLYQNIISRAFNKRVKRRQFAPGQLVMKKIFPHQDEAIGKFSPNWKGPYMYTREPQTGSLWPTTLLLLGPGPGLGQAPEVVHPVADWRMSHVGLPAG
ncbi:uncharacterized protein [Nicotiana sylvestris]|uniref:uncharacterized protein n=1 Tax=Nicotiana sylvestris TaxID=4096 RepID=UPI00388CA924